MNKKRIQKIRLISTAIVTVLMWTYLVWDYFHGGVPTHYLYIIESLPGISNWWGGLVLPLLTWFSLGRVHKRVLALDNDKSVVNQYPKSILFGFVGALILGILISIFFTYGNTSIPMVMMLALIPLALFIPIHRAEYLLGFVLGMTYTFGPILPIGIGGVLVTLLAITYKVIRPGIVYVVSKVRGCLGIVMHKSMIV